MSVIPQLPGKAADNIQPEAIEVSPDVQVTKINIDKCEAFLKTQGFFDPTRARPDEMHPYYEVYMQVVALREKQKNEAEGGAGQGKEQRIFIDGKPGPIMSQPLIEFHSMNGMDMFKGRMAKDGKSFIPGFFACAGALSKAVAMSNNGNPWADLQLLMAYAFLKKMEEELVGKMAWLDELRVKRMELVHRDISWVTPRPEEIARPHDPIFISTQYANLLLDVLVLSDRCSIRFRHAQLNNLIPSKEEIYVEIQNIMKKWRSVAYFIWSGTRMFLMKEPISGATRVNGPRSAPAELEAFVRPHFRLQSATIPEMVWATEKMPPHLAR